jgi:hypothetical protein
VSVGAKVWEARSSWDGPAFAFYQNTHIRVALKEPSHNSTRLRCLCMASSKFF